MRIADDHEVVRRGLRQLLEDEFAGAQCDEAGPPHERLSEREYQVMKRLAHGLNVKQIAAELALGEKTIFTYRTRLLEKLGLHNDVEIARHALLHRLVE